MSPDELLDPEKLPEDLQWLAAEYRLQRNDPVFLLIAWHLSRVQQGEDKLRTAVTELKTAVDSRIESLSSAAETVAGVKDKLGQVQGVLEEKPQALAKQLEVELQKPVRAAVGQIQAAEKSLGGLLRAAESTLAKAQRRQALAAFVVGTVFGAGLLGLFVWP